MHVGPAAWFFFGQFILEAAISFQIKLSKEEWMEPIRWGHAVDQVRTCMHALFFMFGIAWYVCVVKYPPHLGLDPFLSL